jgi:acetylornithine/N-succinyldiaminopimelate aminotransferase
MNLFDVYPRYTISPVKALGAYLYDEKGTKYLDFYGGHGVISIGHSHPQYVKSLQHQIQQIGFYSNSVDIPMQDTLAKKLGSISGYTDYQLFLCNSGAESNENALKLASFHTGKKKVIAFRKSFHGRTAATINVTDNTSIAAPINEDNYPVVWVNLNDEAALTKALSTNDVAAVIIEGIQGVGGLDMPAVSFLQFLTVSCHENGALLILDEIQCGYGRSGKFFAHQYANIRPDLITMAKGMGNGFPLGGVLISPKIKPKMGMLGTTFGGNHLACAAGIAVLEVIDNENLIENATHMHTLLMGELKQIPAIKIIKGKGLMLGLSFDYPVKEIRSKLVYEHQVFTGGSADPHLLRILPPLSINKTHIQAFIIALKKVLL